MLIAAFVAVEARTAEPVLPLWIFRRRVLNAANSGAFVVGVLMLGLTSYVPLYAQAVLGHGALVAGLALAAMTIGWPIAASTSGRFYLTIGFRRTVLMGALFVIAGAALLLPVTPTARCGSWRCRASSWASGSGTSPARASSSPSRASAGSTGAWPPAPTCSPGRWAAPSASRSSARSSTAGSPTAPTGKPLDLEHLSAGVLAPAIHAVFVCTAVVALALLLSGLLMPSDAGDVEKQDA